MRSATAHKIYESDERFEVLSAGTDTTANTVLTRELLVWADTIVAMDKPHRNFIQRKFKDIYKTKRITCLYIPDDYEYMQPELVNIIQHRVETEFLKGHLRPKAIENM